VVASDPLELRAWEQEVEGTPFERVLGFARTSVSLDAGAGGTRVTLELRQRPRGRSRLGGLQLRRAARKELDAALDGLEHVLA